MSSKDCIKEIAELRDAWAKSSNATEDQQKLFEYGELFIAALDRAIAAGGGHPEPPPPRIRP